MKEWDKAREEIFKILFPYADIKRQGDCDMIDKILSLDCIQIKAEDQSLPKLKFLVGDASLAEKTAFLLGVEALKEEILKDDWIRVVKEGDPE